MEKIITVGKSDDIIIKELGFDFVEMPNISTDEELSDFIENRLLEIEFDALIIPLYKENATIVLRLGLHIRLTESLWQKRLATLIFVSTETLATITRDSGIYGHILATKGCKFEQIKSIEMIKKVINSIEPLLIDDFKRKFLNIINIQPDETVGRHSLANQWGALALDKAANTKSLKSDKELQKAQKQLYFKYIIALNFNYNSLKSHKKQLIDLSQFDKTEKIDALSKRILLIDDEADKGWASVLKNIFKVSSRDDFVVIQEKVKDYNSFSEINQKVIQEGNFDLFLIDLRLNGIEEEDIKSPEYFSGTKVLQAIKEQNEGNQIIIFTASNKAWNMKKLLDLGADGYYIKESPEYNFPSTFTKENYLSFKNEVENCFKLSFLREVATIHKICKEKLGNIDFQARSQSALDIAFELLKKSANDLKYRNLAYLTYYQILEDYASQRENFEQNKHDNKCYVIKESTKITVIDSTKKEWWLAFVKKDKTDKKSFDFFKRQKENNDKDWNALAKISFILAFKFGKDDSSLKKWGKLNHLRNTKAGHGGNNGFVTIEEIKELLEIVVLFLTNQ